MTGFFDRGPNIVRHIRVVSKVDRYAYVCSPDSIFEWCACCPEEATSGTVRAVCLYFFRKDGTASTTARTGSNAPSAKRC